MPRAWIRRPRMRASRMLRDRETQSPNRGERYHPTARETFRHCIRVPRLAGKFMNTPRRPRLTSKTPSSYPEDVYVMLEQAHVLSAARRRLMRNTRSSYLEDVHVTLEHALVFSSARWRLLRNTRSSCLEDALVLPQTRRRLAPSTTYTFLFHSLLFAVS